MSRLSRAGRSYRSLGRAGGGAGGSYQGPDQAAPPAASGRCLAQGACQATARQEAGAGRHQLAGRVGHPLRGHPAQGVGRQPDLGRGAGAVGVDVGVADVLAARAFGPGLPQSTPAGPVGGVGLAPVNSCACSLRPPAGRGRMLAADTEWPEVRASWTGWPRTSARTASRGGPRWLPYAPAPRHDGPVRGGELRRHSSS